MTIAIIVLSVACAALMGILIWYVASLPERIRTKLALCEARADARAARISELDSLLLQANSLLQEQRQTAIKRMGEFNELKAHLWNLVKNHNSDACKVIGCHACAAKEYLDGWEPPDE